MNLESFQRARKKIQPFFLKTPLIKCREHIYLKLENLQKTNSFKPRGAFHALLNLSEEEKRRGVVARSSGNFAQALALAAKPLRKAKCD